MSAPLSPEERIVELNDALRRSFCGGRVVFTRGIADLPHRTIGEVVTMVQEFEDFSEDNDPYGEHDFGAFTHPIAGKVFWKIDYYDRAYERGSEDPSNPLLTGRLLTILLAEEW